MTQSPWLAHYPKDVPAELAKVPFVHLGELVKKASNEYSKTIAFTQVMPNGMNGSLTYKKIDSLSDDFAAYLREPGLQFRCQTVWPTQSVPLE